VPVAKMPPRSSHHHVPSKAPTTPPQTSNPSNHFPPSPSTKYPSPSNSTPSSFKSASLLVWFCPLGAFSQSPKKPPMKPLTAMQRWQGCEEDSQFMYVCAWNEPKTELVKCKVYNLQPPARMDFVSTLHLWLEAKFGGRVLGRRRRLRGRRGFGGGGRRLSVVGWLLGFGR
jgi:hypothetical protein